MVHEIGGTIRINHERVVDDSYDVIFDTNLFPRIAREMKERKIRKLKKVSAFVIITDSNTKPLYGDSLKAELKKQGVEVYLLHFDAGEQHKVRETKAELEDQMLALGLGRDTAILALGGGVVGDLAGFVASTYGRGIPYVQIPTTVLSQTDAAVGGKTAVDTPHAKNMIGSFKHPAIVYIDVATLKTLPDVEYRNGLAETIKHGIIQDAEFFRYLEEHADLILERSPESSLYIAKKNCIIKGNVVEQDMHEESGIRMILNYGHTVGHSIEKLSNYKLPHGECVAIGMMVAGRIAVALGTGFTEEDLRQQEALLRKMGLPTVIPPGITNEAIIEIISSDKKAKKRRPRYVLPSRIGAMCDFDGAWATYVENNIVAKALEQTRK